MNTQDWNVTIIGKKKTNNKDPITQMHQCDEKIETLRKQKQNSWTQEQKVKIKLENDEVIGIEKIPNYISKKLQQERSILKITRKELAQKLNIKESIITDIENGNYSYDKQLIRKIERVLNVKLIDQ